MLSQTMVRPALRLEMLQDRKLTVLGGWGPWGLAAFTGLH